MNVLSYVLNLFGILKRTGDECAARECVSPNCPIVKRLNELDIYSQMMLLKKRSLRVKRLALGIVAADIICAIMQAFNIAELAPVDHAIAVHIFWILLIRVALIVGVCFLVVWMLTTGTMKHGIEEGKNGLPTK